MVSCAEVADVRHECHCDSVLNWTDPSCPHCNWAVARCLDEFEATVLDRGGPAELPNIPAIKAWFEQRGFTLLSVDYHRDAYHFMARHEVHTVPGAYRVSARIQATSHAAVAYLHEPEWAA